MCDILYNVLGVLLWAAWVLFLAASMRDCPGREQLRRKPKVITGLAYWLWVRRR